MKRSVRNIIRAILSVMALTTLCGIATANPVNTPFLFVDFNLTTGTAGTQTNNAVNTGSPIFTSFNGWNFSSPPGGGGVTSFSSVSNFPATRWAFSNALTAPGPVTVTLLASNYLDPSGAGSTFTFPGTENTGNSPDVVDRATMSGDPTAALYNDYIYVMHNANIGFGHDFFTLTFSNLFPGTNYEVTLFSFDPGHGDASGYYNAAGTNNPALNQNFTPGSVSSATSNNPSVLIPDTGPWPENSTVTGVAGNYTNELYLYSGSLFVTADANGVATVYMWEADYTFGTYQRVPFNGFALGLATNIVIPPASNAIPTLLNPVPASLGPPTVWPYFAGIAIPSSSTYADQPFGNASNATWMGETFIPTRDVNLRNFDFVVRGTTNSGSYTLVLFDLGVANTVTNGYLTATNRIARPDLAVNLLSHPTLLKPKWWTFSPSALRITNTSIVKFKLPSTLDEVYLTNGHSYFLGLQWNGDGNNDLVWETTTSGLTYTNGAAFWGGISRLTNDTVPRNLIMAVEVLNPNPVISVANSPLTTSWPTVAGMTNSGHPVLLVDDGDGTGADPSYLTEYTGNTPPVNGGILMGLGGAGAVRSMSFYATNSFNLGAIGVRMRGTGSSNVLFTLAVYQITNTFFTATNSIEHWPRNFQPNTDSSPLGIPIFATNVDFYYPTNINNNGTNDQVLILTLPPQYQAAINGSLVSPYSSYAIELYSEDIGQNASAGGLFQLMRDVSDSLWQEDLFPDVGGGIGFRTNSASAGAFVLVEPMMLTRPNPDPETVAGDVVGQPGVRQMVMALYAAPAAPVIVYPTSIHITSVTHTGSNTVLNWSEVGGSGAYTYSVYRSSNLSTPKASWTLLQSSIPAGTTTYTDTTASGTPNFYVIHSP